MKKTVFFCFFLNGWAGDKTVSRTDICAVFCEGEKTGGDPQMLFFVFCFFPFKLFLFIYFLIDTDNVGQHSADQPSGVVAVEGQLTSSQGH